jgi:hypothetical protein
MKVLKKLARISSVQTLCVDLKKMPLITFWSKCLEDDDKWIGLFLPLWNTLQYLPPTELELFLLIISFQENVCL